MKLYDIELNENKAPMLVEEKAFRYSSRIHTYKDMAEMLNTCFHLNQKAEEHVYLISLDNKMNVNGVFLLSKGIVNCSICRSREIFIRLLAVGAINFIIAHNHPSGDISPSKEDIDVFNNLKDGGSLLGIPCLDSVIVGDNDSLSLKEYMGL